MNSGLKNNGFSLTEVLLAVGILAVGMIFIAGVFPVGIYFTTVATERTIAAVIADEAFAKIRLYAKGDPEKAEPGDDDIDLNELEEDELQPDGSVDFNDIFPAAEQMNPSDFAYPSDPKIAMSQKQYYWSVLCRSVKDYSGVDDPNRSVQVTVFVCRKVGKNLKYPSPSGSGNVSRPTPVKIEVLQGSSDNELEIDKTKEKTFINDGYTIVDDESGDLYRVLERYKDDPVTSGMEDMIILLDRDWQGSSSSKVWVVPPPVGSGRGPCIAVYQKVIKF